MSTDHLASGTPLVLKGSPRHFILCWLRLFSLFHSRCPSMGPVSNRNNGPWTVRVPHGSCHPQRQDWHAWSLLKYWIRLKTTCGFFRGRLQKWNKKSEMSLPPLICPIAPLCVILLFSVAFCLYKNGTGRHNWIERKGRTHLQRSHPNNES